MKKNTKKIIRALVLFCAVMMLVYTFAVILPHTHSVFNSECMLCVVMGSARFMVCGALLCALVCSVPDVASIFFAAYSDLRVERSETPVGLKVKLSD